MPTRSRFAPPAILRLISARSRAVLAAALLSGAFLASAHGQVDGGADGTYITSSALGDVYVVQTNADGSAILGGNFTMLGSLTCTGLARLKAGGTVDTAFHPTITESNTALTASVQALAYDPSGNLLVGGQFTAINGVACRNLARLKADGSVDRAFAASVGTGTSTDVVRAIVALSDGTVLVGGSFTYTLGNATVTSLARLMANGTLDTTFNPGTGVSGTVKTIVVQGDGAVVIGGDFTAVNGVVRRGLARVAAGGALDSTYLPGLAPSANVLSAVAQPDGKLYVGGSFTYPNTTRANIIRLNGDGTLDNTFFGQTGGTNSTVSYLARQPDGRVLIGGPFTTVFSASDPTASSPTGTTTSVAHAARLYSDGTQDPTFSAGSLNNIAAFGFLANGNLLIGTTVAGPGTTNQISSLSASQAGLIMMALSKYSLLDTPGKVLVLVKRGGTSAASVAYTYSDGSLNGTLTWATGDTSPRTITLPISASTQASRSFTFALVPPTSKNVPYTVGGTSSKAQVTVAHGQPPHPTFFGDEISLGSGVDYLRFSGNSLVFGIYAFQSDPNIIYHYDLGRFFYVFDANDGSGGVYFYDYGTSRGSLGFLYTSPLFSWPYFFDFKTNHFLYYFVGTSNPCVFADLSNSTFVSY